MKVLIADKFEQSGIDGLKAIGCEVISNPDLKDDALVAANVDTPEDFEKLRADTATSGIATPGTAS